MKSALSIIAIVALVLNALIVVSIFEHTHASELRAERKQHAVEMSALQAELDHTRQMAAAMHQMLSQREQGQQLERWVQ